MTLATRSSFLLLLLAVAGCADLILTTSAFAQPPVVITRSEAQQAALLEAASRIVPRRLDGTPAPDGKIVVVGLGMSVARGTFDGLKYHLRWTVPDVHPRLVIANYAENGRYADDWANPLCDCWNSYMEQKRAQLGVSHLQVGVVLMKMTEYHPVVKGETTAQTAVRFLHDMRTVLALAEARFPNAQILLPGSMHHGRPGTTPSDLTLGYLQSSKLQTLQDTWEGRTALAAWHAWHAPGVSRADGLLIWPEWFRNGGPHLTQQGYRHVAEVALIQWLWAEPWTAGVFRP